MAAIGFAGAVAIAWRHRSSAFAVVALPAVVAVSAWLSIIDFREHRLPNRIVGPLAAAVTVGVVAAGLVADDLDRSARAIGFGLVLSAVLLAASLIGGLGMGDVKYGYPMAATVGWFGWDALSTAIVVTTVSGAAVATILLVAGRGRQHQLSYGPYMALGLVVGLVVAGR